VIRNVLDLFSVSLPCVNMASTFDFNKEWELSMERQRKRLGKKSKRIQSVSYDKFKKSLTEARDKYNRAPTTVVLQKLQPLFDQLHNFVNAITSIVQSSPELAGFIWGAIQAVLTVRKEPKPGSIS